MSKGKQSSEGTVTVHGGSGAEREVQARSYDEAAVAERMNKLNEAIRNKREQDKRIADELAKIVVNPADVDVVAREFGISAQEATNKLRQQKGGPDLNALLREYVGLPRKKVAAAA